MGAVMGFKIIKLRLINPITYTYVIENVDYSGYFKKEVLPQCQDLH
jgi:hypothetical protein